MRELTRIGYRPMPSREIRNCLRDIAHLLATYPEISAHWNLEILGEFRALGQELATPENSASPVQRQRFRSCCHQLSVLPA